MTPGTRDQVESALLDYHRSPGKHSLALRQPVILFSSIKEVLQLASGRMPEGAATPAPGVQGAAGFFVRSAMLYPGADHYALLGVERSATDTAIKDRYRQMMRLMHPDFAGSALGWPADAASRINQAYEILASAVQRRSYDDKLDAEASPQPQAAPVAQAAAIRAAAARPPAPDPRRLLKRIAVAFGILGILALGGSFIASGPDRESLVQRQAPPSPAQVAAQPAEPKPPVETAALTPPSPTPEHAPMLAAIPVPTDRLQPATAMPIPATKAVPVITSEARGFAAPPAAAPPAAAQMIAVSERAGARITAAPLAAPAALPAPVTPIPVAVAGPVPVTAMAISPPAPPQPPPAAQTVAAPALVLAQTQPPADPLPATQLLRAPAVTLAEAHNSLAKLLQQMETGSSDRLLDGMDRAVRNTPATQSLARQYSTMVEGARQVKVGNVQLRGEPKEDRLLVTGQVSLEISDYRTTRTRELALHAEFARQEGAVVLTRLAPAGSRAQ